jgi:hypothetical protein
MVIDLPDAELQYEVEVIIKGNDGSAFKNLRVYYVMNGYYRTPPPASSSFFPSLGPRVFATLPVHKFRIWIAKDGYPGNPLITPRVIYVDRKLTVELSLQELPER